MNKKKVLADVLPLAIEACQTHGLTLFDIELTKRSGNYVLSVYIDKQEGVSLDDCQRVHIVLDAALDNLDPIPDAYFLEVASPGLDAPLKSELALEQSIGKDVQVKTFVSIGGEKRHLGTLYKFDAETVTIGGVSGEINIPRDKIASIRLDSKL